MRDAPSFQRLDGDWTFLYFVSKAAEGGGFVGAVEMRQMHAVYCRLVSQSSMSSDEAIIDRLEGHCREWLDRPAVSAPCGGRAPGVGLRAL
ncbi:hypothetical protein D3C71_1565280 [compost metagenome]